MKNWSIHPLLAVSILFSFFLVGLLLGRLSPVHGNILGNSTASPPLYQAGASDPPDSSSNSRLIDINSADVEELTLLPGIGQVLAERIIDYRETNGSFSSTKQLTDIKGIGDEIFAKIEQYICAGGQYEDSGSR